MAIVSSRLSAARSLLQRHNLYGSPPRHSFYSCASSRALLHVGLLSLWDRQPSNAPPLLLSPAGLASRRGPHTKTHLGLCPKAPLPLNCGWIRTMRSIVRTAHRYAPKVAAGAFLSPPRWSAEGRTTTPVPSSEEGNYGASKTNTFKSAKSLPRQIGGPHPRTATPFIPNFISPSASHHPKASLV